MFQRTGYLKTGERILVRSLLRSDLVPLHKMYDSLSPESKGFFAPAFFEHVGTGWLLSNLSLVLATFSRIKRLLAFFWPRAVSPSLVAVNSRNELIGFAYLVGGKRKALGIGLRDDYQNIGLGTHIIYPAIFELARREGLREVYGWVPRGNTRALHVDEKFGFRPIEYSDDQIVLVKKL